MMKRFLQLFALFFGMVCGYSAHADIFKIDRASARFAKIEIKNGVSGIKITHGNQFINASAKPAEADKTYRNISGAFVVRVKKKADSIKLYNQNGILLWKIKIDRGTYKISNNEESKNAWQIKSQSGKFKVYDSSGKIRAELRFYDKKSKLKDTLGKALYEVDTALKKPAAAVLALEQLPMQLRLVLFAELILP